MTKNRDGLRIGTRGSDLARWQADFVAAAMPGVAPGTDVETVVLSTRGDRNSDVPLPHIGGKGAFTAEIEAALRCGEIDLAVHSLKDLPTQDAPDLVLAACTQRGSVHDVLVCRSGRTLHEMDAGTVVGTSSRRRAAQLLAANPRLRTMDIRGNVLTRVAKVLDAQGPFDATVMAQVGLERLGRVDVITEVLPLDVMLPAPGQGALGIQCRADSPWLPTLRRLNHLPSQLAVAAERAFLSGLGGGCSLPIAAFATFDQDLLVLRGRVLSADGRVCIERSLARPLPPSPADATLVAQELGLALARTALEAGASALLECAP